MAPTEDAATGGGDAGDTGGDGGAGGVGGVGDGGDPVVGEPGVSSSCGMDGGGESENSVCCWGGEGWNVADGGGEGVAHRV